MNIIYTPSPLLKEVKFRNESLPVVIRVNKFDEKAAEDFSKSVMRAQNTGQPVLPVVIDSYGGPAPHGEAIWRISREKRLTADVAGPARVGRAAGVE